MNLPKIIHLIQCGESRPNRLPIEFNEEISGNDDTEPAKSKVFTDRKDLPASFIDLEQLQEANH